MELIGLDISYFNSNNIKFLINLEIGIQELKPLKLITNRSIYDLNIIRYNGNIEGIDKTDIKNNLDPLELSTKIHLCMKVFRS